MQVPLKSLSLSARRAWIEMLGVCQMLQPAPVVALRKESVDRNRGRRGLVQLWRQSLSARRAWIEIAPCMGI